MSLMTPREITPEMDKHTNRTHSIEELAYRYPLLTAVKTRN